jgi:hypothetical protein
MIVDIKKNTDQLNFEDFLGGVTRIVTIAKVEKGRKEGQYDIAIEGDDRYWRPPPTVLKQLVSAWTDEADTWVGRQALLYGDPDVMMAGQVVGGIRVSHVSHIDGPVTESLSVTRGKRRPHTLHPLPDPPKSAPKPPTLQARLTAALAARGITERADWEDFCKDVIGRAAPSSELSDEEMAQVVEALEQPIGEAS